MKVLITGSNGFIGKNLKLHLSAVKEVETFCFNKEDSFSTFAEKIKTVDFIFHLAGINRSEKDEDFKSTNAELTFLICQELIKIYKKTSKKIPILFSSSIQVNSNNIYGKTKKEAEEILLTMNKKYKIPIIIYRLPNVFGKWCKPNYNSVVATFCHNISSNLPIKIIKNKTLNLVYIDDVIEDFISKIKHNNHTNIYNNINPIYKIKVEELKNMILSFKQKRENCYIDEVGLGLTSKLYSTYISYLSSENFSVKPRVHSDSRGIFVEILKTKNSGQFSFFTALPGVTRGSHYHHSKTEKFIVLQGKALFKFHNLNDNSEYEITASEDEIQIIDTSPGWVHKIKNIGNTKLVVMLWVNEVFDPKFADTINYSI